MRSYGLLSPMHWDHVQRKIAGAICSDEDSFRFLTSEVEQWRGSSLKGMNHIRLGIQDDPNIFGKPAASFPHYYTCAQINCSISYFDSCLSRIPILP